MQSAKRYLTALVSLAVVGSFLTVSVPATAVGSSVAMTTSGCAGGAIFFCFQPGSVFLGTGGTVTWTNSSIAPHTATSDTPGGWDAGQVNPSGMATISFPTAGIYPYHCAIHTYMHGTVYVGVTPRIAFPSVANAAYGGYTTAAYIENIGGAAASLHIRYFDQAGNPVGAGDDLSSLAPKATWTVRQDNGNSLAPGAAGSAIVYSDQAVAAFINEFAPAGGDGSSYSGIRIGPETGTALHAPTIANNAYGGYTTGIGIVNVSDMMADILITYRDQAGAVVTTKTLAAVPSHAYRDAFSGTAGLPDGFAGTATITSSQNLAAVVNEVGPHGQFSSYDAPVGGTNILHAPVMLNGGFGGYYTGIGIRNTTANAGSVTVTYYDGAGSVAKTVTKAISGNGYLAIYQGDPNDGPPASGTGYSADLTPSTGVFIAAVVNEIAPPGSGPGRQFTSYNMFLGGSTVINLPLVENAGSDGWSTGIGIMNTGVVTGNTVVTYFDAATGSALLMKNVSVPAHAFVSVYTPNDLPAGTRASAQLATAPTGPIVAIVNESNATSFMSYGGQ